MNYKTTILIGIFLFLTACSTNFHLQENNRIQKVNVWLTFDSTINDSQQKLIRYNFEQFIDEYQVIESESMHLFSDSLSQPDLTMNIERVLTPSRTVKVLAKLIGIGSLIFILSGNQYAYLSAPLLFINATSTTFYSLDINPQLVKNVKEFPKDLRFQSIRGWDRKNVEEIKHLKLIDSHFQEIFRRFLKEYRKKNP